MAGKLQRLEATLGEATVTLQEYSYFPDGNLKQQIEHIDPAVPERQRITDYTYTDNGLNVQSMTTRGATSGVPVTISYMRVSWGQTP